MNARVDVPDIHHRPIREEIAQLKRARGAIVLAHNYQRQEVQEIADFVGDSLELARFAAKQASAAAVVLCGVRFMAETAKILRPDSEVILPEPDAGCNLADSVTPDDVADLRRNHPGAWVVSYVNTSAQVKAASDVCCTSANAAAVVSRVPSRTVVFLPDKNLCWHVRRAVPDKEIVCWSGSCAVHRLFSAEDVRRVRDRFPDAEVLVHPECDPDVQEAADAVLSTSGMVRRAQETPASTVIIGTEEGILARLRAEAPDKTFYCLGAARMCATMKMTTLEKVRDALRPDAERIALPRDVMDGARAALERMLEFS